MKNLVLLAISLSLISMSGLAQVPVEINIHHKLGMTDFEMEKASKNNLDYDFEVTRLQYYVSQISIVHDGGIETPFEAFWALINAERSSTIYLPESNIESVEKLKFHIGVGPEYNHLDPASYPEFHPLAPTFPSMHWGWDPGYRFVALEGNGGSNLDQSIQLHGLGDENYFMVEIDIAATVVDDKIILNIDADYNRALENIELNAGVIVHGQVLQAKQCLENFRDFVFSESSTVSSTADVSEIEKFEVYPNPTFGNATIILKTVQELDYSIAVTDVLGKQVQLFDVDNRQANIDLQLSDAGFYFISLIKEGQPVITKRLMVE